MRQPYHCKCDRCMKPIYDANEENDVTLNAGKYVYCDICYQELLGIWEKWIYEKR